MRVLLVEDHIDIRRLFEQVIEARGHDVTACADGESAWEAYSRRPYELVLLDWELRGGGMDGLQVCRTIRSSPGGDRCDQTAAIHRRHGNGRRGKGDARGQRRRRGIAVRTRHRQLTRSRRSQTDCRWRDGD